MGVISTRRRKVNQKTDAKKTKNGAKKINQIQSKQSTTTQVIGVTPTRRRSKRRTKINKQTFSFFLSFFLFHAGYLEKEKRKKKNKMI